MAQDAVEGFARAVSDAALELAIFQFRSGGGSGVTASGGGGGSRTAGGSITSAADGGEDDGADDGVAGFFEKKGFVGYLRRRFARDLLAPVGGALMDSVAGGLGAANRGGDFATGMKFAFQRSLNNVPVLGASVRRSVDLRSRIMSQAADLENIARFEEVPNSLLRRYAQMLQTREERVQEHAAKLETFAAGSDAVEQEFPGSNARWLERVRNPPEKIPSDFDEEMDYWRRKLESERRQKQIQLRRERRSILGD